MTTPRRITLPLRLTPRLQPLALLPMLLPALLLSLYAAAPAHGHYSSAYSHDGDVKTFNPDWMSRLPDEAPLSGLSIPGTHDSHALYGGDAVQCQEMQFKEQLLSGIRVFDIRCRHINNACAIHHGAFYQHANLDDALSTFADFLTAHPGEVLLMRLKSDEYPPSGNTRSWYDTMMSYAVQYDKALWKPTSQLASPLLGEVRGRIVILQDFSVTDSSGAPYWFGLDYNAVLDVQDNYSFSTNWDLYDKWEDVRSQLVKASASTNTSQFFMNYLSASGGSFPYFVASGHSSSGTSANRLSTGLTTCPWLCDKDKYPDFPRTDCVGSWCTISFEGTNVLAAAWAGFEDGANAGKPPRVGIVMADFPGPGLIEKVIAANCIRADGFTAMVGSDHVGDDLANVGSTDIATVASACAGNPSCRAFNGQGWIKSNAGPTGPAAGFCFYAKTKQNAAVSDGSTVSIAPGTSLRSCLDVPHNQQTPGTALWQWDCNNSPAQKFTLRATGDGYFSLRTSGGLCLTVAGGDQSGAGKPIILMGCLQGLTSQQFAIATATATATAAATATATATAAATNAAATANATATATVNFNGTSTVEPSPALNRTTADANGTLSSDGNVTTPPANNNNDNNNNSNTTQSVNNNATTPTVSSPTAPSTVNAPSPTPSAVNSTGNTVNATTSAPSANTTMSSSSFSSSSSSSAGVEMSYALSYTSSYTLAPRSLPGLCVDIRSGSDQEGAAVQVWGCNGSAAQLFTIG